MKRIAIFASGGGSNAQQIINHLRNVEGQTVGLIVSNRSEAGVLDIAISEGIPCLLISRKDLSDEAYIIRELCKHQIDFIVLAGFIAMIPPYLVHAFEHSIINIHPSLLPKYGGKGMYGGHVHQAVKDAGEQMSGMTIHYVNEAYDEGAIILQARVPILPEDSAEDIGAKVLKLEHFYYPLVVEELVKQLPE